MTLEIIETYWNVNFALRTIFCIIGFEIIETYWNVNAFPPLYLLFSSWK